jgi:NADH-quinone oxidoreductase subunit A
VASTAQILAVGINYLPIMMIIVTVTLMACTVSLISYGIGPGRKGQVKDIPYECGITPVGDAKKPFHARFYLLAILFLLFDVELIFYYPFALVFNNETLKNAGTSVGEAAATGDAGRFFVEILIFSAILVVAIIYAWKRGVFDWR